MDVSNIQHCFQWAVVWFDHLRFGCKQILAISGAYVASILNLSPSAVTKLASRGRKDSRRDKIEKVIFNLNH